MNNRQEIAARLRETGEWFKNHQADIRYMACHIKQIISPNSTLEYQDVFSRLADLVDPTCEYLPCACVTWVDDNGEEHEEKNLEEFGYSEGAYCSVCGYEMMTGEEGWFDYKREEHGNRLIPNFNYCPNCDARVVKDD